MKDLFVDAMTATVKVVTAAGSLFADDEPRQSPADHSREILLGARRPRPPRRPRQHLTAGRRRAFRARR